MVPTVAVIGLGYVGLPLAVEFGKRYRTIGFDLSASKIDAYRKFIDPTGEVSTESLKLAIRGGGLEPTSNSEDLADADFLIIAVPTPVDSAHIPDFGPLIKASEIVGTHMKLGATVVYESTVYPGATEEICVPLLEKSSGRVWRKDFHVGYSPERINPGDKEHTLTKILKVVSGDDANTLDKLATLYRSIIAAGVHRASNIRVAEAAKVIENTQRDLNIALMNELAIIFDRLDLNTNEVLEAAGTKWNFLKFKPGLVGGHCIGVDPYYLTHKAEMMGYHPQVILAGRRINDGMGKFIAEKTVKLMIRQGVNIKDAKVIVLGVTFKEDCPDVRNSKVADVIEELSAFGCQVSVHDPIANSDEVRRELHVELSAWDDLPSKADAIVLAVAHREYSERPVTDLLKRLEPSGVLVDVKGAVPQTERQNYWSL
jgi:UDP-N-acetyl-D-galactosamine dehydrogenase